MVFKGQTFDSHTPGVNSEGWEAIAAAKAVLKIFPFEDPVVDAIEVRLTASRASLQRFGHEWPTQLPIATL